VEAEYQTRHVYNQFVIAVEDRDELKAWLQESGVGTEIYYPMPMHLQPCYRELSYKEGDFPVSEAAARETLALPVHPAMPAEDVEYVSQLIADFCRRGGEARA
jgi:dTDP-4-amino-4,6-dideoxygalactose transaminase